MRATARTGVPLTADRSTGIGLVGYGYWGRNYGRVFDQAPGAEVVAICDESIDRLTEARHRLRHVETTLSVDQLLSSPDVDAVVVATQATRHFDIARRALRAGKHVLVEKPLTTRSSDAVALTDLAEAAGLTLMVGHTFLYNPGVQKLKQIVDSGDLGVIYSMYARRTNLGPIREDVNAVWDLAPHDIAIFNHLVGAAPLWVSATGARVLRNDREDVGFISLGYPRNIIAHVHVSWADPNKTREVVVVGSRQRVVFDDLATLEQVRVFEKGVSAVEDAPGPNFGTFRLSVRDGDILSPRLAVAEPLEQQSLHFLDCVRTRRAPITDGRLGTDVVRVMEAVDRSMAQRGAPADLDAGVAAELGVPA